MKEFLKELIDLFSLMPDWLDRYNYIIDIRDRLSVMPESIRTPEHRIDCNSQLFFYVSYKEDICHIAAFSNTPIPAGLASLLYLIFNNRSRDEIREHYHLFTHFLQITGLLENLSTKRREAFLSMIEKIVQY